MRDTTRAFLVRGKSVGFVPTMGALHEGHMSLVKRAKEENDKTIVSIFVNPLQFGPSEDFDRYPRNVEADTEKLVNHGVDILFLPEVSLMYPDGFSTHVEVTRLSDSLCGAFRPGHFRGVATVVAKLFNIVNPTRAYFGQKDYQQSVIIKRMVRDLDMDIDVVVCPTIREKDGLAMSSRNAYLTPAERGAAATLYRALKEAADGFQSGIINIELATQTMRERILQEPLFTKLDYAGVYDPETLEELDDKRQLMLLAAAAWIGNTRMIDNILVTLGDVR